jgi:hypothetical protein
MDLAATNLSLVHIYFSYLHSKENKKVVIKLSIVVQYFIAIIIIIIVKGIIIGIVIVISISIIIGYSYRYTYKKEILVVRANNIYGIRQFPEKLISRSIVNIIKNKPIPIHGNGKNVRYYLSVVDFANALVILVKKKNKGIYNIGSSYYEKNINIAKKICKLFNKDPKKFIVFVKDRLYNDKRYSVSSQ